MFLGMIYCYAKLHEIIREMTNNERITFLIGLGQNRTMSKGLEIVFSL